MSVDGLRQQLNARVGALWLSTGLLVKLIDHPGSTLEVIRGHAITTGFRQEVRRMTGWMMASTRTLPDDQIPPEERKFWELWFKLIDKQEVDPGASGPEREILTAGTTDEEVYREEAKGAKLREEER